MRTAQPKPFGWEVDVWLDPLHKTERTLHYRGSESTARTRALLKKDVWDIKAIRPVEEAEWRRAYGDPETRGL